MAAKSQFDLIILDIMLPGINGLELCKIIKKNTPTVPIIMLTALGTTENVVNGLDNLDAIAAVAGVDGLFIGPADLSAAMGHRGNPGHPDVAAAIEDAIRRVRQAGKAVGILSADPTLARRYIELGAHFVAVGVDTTVLMKGLQSLAGQYKGHVAPTSGGGVY